MNCQCSKVKAWFKSLISDPSTGGHLNYITLHIRDETMRKKLEEELVKKFDAIYWIALCFAPITIIINVFNYLNQTS